jgi:hypothetical protein
VWILGACQCVFWGILYYGFSALLPELEREHGRDRATVAGAFTGGLLVAALAAPLVGRWIDRDRARGLFRTGAALAVAGIVALVSTRTLAAAYGAWLVLGLAMGTLLYESAFGLVLRAFDDGAERLRALAAVTVAGGLASTLFLPAFAMGIERYGWRVAWLGAGAILLLAYSALELFVFPHLRSTAAALLASAAPPVLTIVPAPPSAHLTALALLFASTTFAGMAFPTLLIPLLLERGHSATVAASTLGLLGAMQLPGRIWILRGSGGGRRLVSGPLALQAIGLAAVAFGARSLSLVAAGSALFGLGSGLHTIARPWLVHAIAGDAHAGRWNGQIARYQGLARAAGPLAVASLAGARGTPAAFAALATVLALLAPVAWRLARATR